MKTVIGIVGVKTSGKSTVSQMIKEFISNEYVKEVALADKLKNVCSEVFGIPRNTFDDQRYKEIPFSVFNIEKRLSWFKLSGILDGFDYTFSEHHGKFDKIADMELTSARHIAQIVGTQVLRALGDEDIHCNSVDLSSNITIISDIRFPNEYNFFSNKKDTKFIPLYVNRDLAEAEVDMEKSHASETSVFIFRDKCIKLNNNGSLGELEKEVQTAINKEFYGIKKV